MIGPEAGEPRNWVRFKAGARVFPLPKESLLALEPIHPTIHWVLGGRALSAWQSGGSLNFIAHIHLTPTLRMYGAITSLPNVFMGWCIIKSRDKFTFAILRRCHLSILQNTRSANYLVPIRVHYDLQLINFRISFGT